MSNEFIIQIDPRFFQGTDATNHTCQWCHIRPAVHVHHKEFKKLGGAGKKAKKDIERPENKMEACLTCHEAFHGIRSITLDGFCCDVCPKLPQCYYGARLLGLPFDYLPQYTT